MFESTPAPRRNVADRTAAPPAPQPQLPRGLHAGAVLALQRSAGNRAVTGMLARTAVPDTEPVFDPSKPTVLELQEIADKWIGQYWGAAHQGLDDFDFAMRDGMTDYAPLLTALAGNLLWAAACFATGPTAFVVSLAGIGIGMGAPYTSGKVDAGVFRRVMSDTIDGITNHLKQQIVRVATDSWHEAEGGSDVGARLLMMRRLLDPAYIDPGSRDSIPTVNQPAIAHQVAKSLLLQANAYTAGLQHPFGGGRFVYEYELADYTSPTGGIYGDVLKPVADWKITPAGTGAYIPQGAAAALAELKKDPMVSAATSGWTKTIVLRDERSSGTAFSIHFGADNTFTAVSRTGPFLHLDPGEREAQEVVQRVWGGPPPDIASAQLTLLDSIPLPLHEFGR
ncbi:hypothetical protein [Solirubrobacter soli]|uniref:hypothetical protein n=1 Tax=Solirubrobacter soli TaxID=363832 RepID=UPI00042819C4|nr:hypothetical protein [Solirubrobacter soli]